MDSRRFICDFAKILMKVAFTGTSNVNLSLIISREKRV